MRSRAAIGVWEASQSALPTSRRWRQGRPRSDFRVEEQPGYCDTVGRKLRNATNRPITGESETDFSLGSDIFGLNAYALVAPTNPPPAFDSQIILAEDYSSSR